MDDPADSEIRDSTTSAAPGTRAAGEDPQRAERVDVAVRITPLSLLFSSVLGTSVLGALVTGGLLLLPVGVWPAGIRPADNILLETAPPLRPEWGLGLLLVYGILLSAIFFVGYRRHGRPVPTEARVRDGTLAVRVPEAWGTLIRDEVHLDAPHVDRPRSEAPSAPVGDDSGSAALSGGALRAIGTAEEWWDPGTYEVHADAGAAEVLGSELPVRE